ncbi:hypothetical protein [Phormidesmis sp. 146-33]
MQPKILSIDRISTIALNRLLHKCFFFVSQALPQTLAYMSASPNLEKTLYGMVMNGSSYLFVKVLEKQYGISDLFSTRSQYRNGLYEVLRILTHLGQLTISQ